MDQSKKTMRHFYCRDVLWGTFEQMANDFDCSIDYLINESMRYYARQKNYHSGVVPNQAIAPPAGNNHVNHGAPGHGAPNHGPPGHGPPSHGPPSHGPPHAGMQPQPQPAAGGYGAPPAGAYGAPDHGAPDHGAPRGRTSNPPPPPMAARGGARPSGPPMGGPQPQPAGGGYQPQASGTPTLYLIYNNQRYPVTKEQFIIGRGSKTSDLPIKDGNISRKHAAVIRRNGTYYIKDLGSTNGIDYKGMRIDNKRIDEGDVFHLCDYELRFTYRPD